MSEYQDIIADIKIEQDGIIYSLDPKEKTASIKGNKDLKGK